jgi:hypothetical protein
MALARQSGMPGAIVISLNAVAPKLRPRHPRVNRDLAITGLADRCTANREQVVPQPGGLIWIVSGLGVLVGAWLMMR